uniref:Uncharacterized protein n=1 Tax=Romanomermis culicivorax TaxID=13658 RepID=A0A915IXJ5_ROMCU
MQFRSRQFYLLFCFCLFLFWTKFAFFGGDPYKNFMQVVSSVRNDDQDHDYYRFKRTFADELYVSNSSFSPKSDVFLKELKLSNEDLIAKTGDDESEEFEEKRVLESAPIFVTAFSDNHFHEAMNLMESIKTQYKEKIVVVYDIGLNNDSIQSVKTKFPNILHSIKKFPFEIYPKFVSNLLEYRWKPLIIARELKHWPSIVWMDSSIVHHKHVENILKFYKNCSQISKIFAKCSRYPWHMFDFTGHSIFAATKSGMYDFLPVPKEQSSNISMIGANIQLVFGTKKLKRQILRYWVLCALEEKCMAPDGSNLGCNFENDRYSRYAECHRFDQSALNILLAWANDFYLDRYYSSNFSSIFEVRRFG